MLFFWVPLAHGDLLQLPRSGFFYKKMYAKDTDSWNDL